MVASSSLEEFVVQEVGDLVDLRGGLISVVCIGHTNSIPALYVSCHTLLTSPIRKPANLEGTSRIASMVSGAKVAPIPRAVIARI